MLKKESKKGIVLGVLALLLVVGICFSSYHVTADARAHTHNFKYTVTSYNYLKKNETVHLKTSTPIYMCACGEKKFGTSTHIDQGHEMTGWKSTYENYHSGAKHYYKYENRCKQCAHCQTQWRSVSCSKDGKCAQLQSVKPIELSR